MLLNYGSSFDFLPDIIPPYFPHLATYDGTICGTIFNLYLKRILNSRTSQCSSPCLHPRTAVAPQN